MSLMEPNITKQTVVVHDMVYEGSLEQPAESDVLLPDYCPDIVKILRCFCRPVITGMQAAGDKLTVDLNCMIRVYYLGSDKNIRCVEQKLPYTKSCDLRSSVSDPVVDAAARADYINCRAVNQRRFEIRCAVSISCRVFSRTQAEVIDGAQGCGIQLKSSQSDVTQIMSDTTRQFSMHEDLQLAAQKPPVQSVIRQDCCCRIGDYKVVGGKVILKGELVVHLLYQPENEGARPEIMEYALPVSQIVDADGVDEESVCDVALDVIQCEFTPKPNLDGESRLIAMDCTLGARVRAHRRQKLGLVTDCYSTEYECRMERAPICCLNLVKVADERLVHKCGLDMDDGADTVLDLFCLVTDASSRAEAGAVVAVVKLLIGLFACTPDGDIVYREQAEECEIRIPVDSGGDGLLFFPHAQVLSCSFSMAGTQAIDCRVEVAVCGCVYALMRPKVAVALTCDTENPKERGTDASLVIYYAEGGEDVWEIAKRYNTSIEAVMAENGLDTSTLPEKKMLLIPII